LNAETLAFLNTADNGMNRLLWREFAEVAPLFREGAATQLTDALSEASRKHHNLHHILTIMRLARPLYDLAIDPLGLRIALLFQDAIYHIPLSAAQPLPRDNEERSIRFMAMQAVNPAHPSILHAAELIRGTITHDARRGLDGPLMHDLDLSILAVRRSRYAQYEQNLRAEYDVFPQPLYCSARTAILRTLLDRPRVYASPYLASKWENAARDNISWAIKQLAQSLIPGEAAYA